MVKGIVAKQLQRRCDMSGSIREFSKFFDDVRPVVHDDGKPPAHEWLLFRMKEVLDSRRPDLTHMVFSVSEILYKIMIPKKHVDEVISIVREFIQRNDTRRSPLDTTGSYQEDVDRALKQLLEKLTNSHKAGKYK